MRLHNNNSVSLIEGLILFKVALVFIPAMSYYGPPGLNLILETIIYVSLISRIGLNRTLKVIFAVVPILLLQIVEYCITDENFVYKSYMVFKYFLWAVIIGWIYVYDKVLFARKILVCIIMSFMITAITTIVGNGLFPGASRFMAVGEYMAENQALLSKYMMYNIGDFVFVYSSIVFLPVLIYIWKDRLYNRYLILALIVLIFWLSVATKYTTAIVASLLCYTLFFLKKNFSLATIVKLAVIGGGGIVFSANILSGILNNISSSIDSESISSRLSDVSAILSGSELDENSSDLYARTERNRISIETIKQNPLFGSGGVWASKGGHSLLLDYIALFGVLGLLMEFVVFASIYKKSVRPARGSLAYGYLLFGFIIQLFLSAVNPQIFYHVFLFIYPLVVFIAKRNQENNPLVIKKIRRR